VSPEVGEPTSSDRSLGYLLVGIAVGVCLMALLVLLARIAGWL
jgi:hypothetical protein